MLENNGKSLCLLVGHYTSGRPSGLWITEGFAKCNIATLNDGNYNVFEHLKTLE